MGKLAFYGAMAGIGKGWEKAAIANEDARQRDLQRAHDTTIEKLRMDFQTKERAEDRRVEGERHEARMGLAQEQLEETRNVNRGLQAHRESMANIAQQNADTAAQNADTAAESADTSRKVALSQVGQNTAQAELYRAQAKAMNEGRYGRSGSAKRWSVTKHVIDDGFERKEAPAITDNVTGLSFIQHGDKMVLASPDGQVPTVPEPGTPAHDEYETNLQVLLRNPEKWDVFAEHYKFIPMSAWSSVFGTGTSSEPDTDE